MTVDAAATTRRVSILASLWKVLVDMASRPSGALGLALVAFHIVLAIISPAVIPFDFKVMDASAILGSPSAEHWLGTDNLGRDVLSRTMLGGRQALVVTSIATVFAIAWGGMLGVFLGLIGGWLESIVMRLVDAFLSIPWILFLLLIVSVVGLGNAVLIPTLAFFYGIPVVRMARAATHDVVALDFITAARARGESRTTIVRKELLPNVLDVLLVEGAMRWSWMLLAFSSLSFLGFGVSPPAADWGLMISGARGFMAIAPWAVLAPVVALSTLIIGINLSADALAKALGIDRAQKAPV
ncbi:ABC transporter permease [Rhodobacteraceae bacterium R_SAG10]|nr:ABC transporter permease [Rhodobacteraceae bacterium R_SAG10]